MKQLGCINLNEKRVPLDYLCYHLNKYVIL